MNKTFDAGTQRDAAIKSLRIKQKELLTKATGGFHILSEQHCLEVFQAYCDKIKIHTERGWVVDTFDHPIAKAARQYIQLEEWIERLNAGEDPSTIVYEAVSLDI